MYRSERKIFRCSFMASIGTHVGIILVALLLSWIIRFSPPPQPPEEKSVEVEFTSDSNGQETPAKAEVDSSNPNAPAPEKLEAPPSPTPPVNAPAEETPPPPPPPSPMPPPPEAVAKLETQPSPLPKAEETPAPAEVTLPPAMSPLASSSNAHVPSPPSPMPIPTALPQVQNFSRLTKMEKAKKEIPDTHSLESTLNAYQADQKQIHPPRSKANPRQGGAPNGGGARNGDITKGLSSGVKGKIAESVRRCYVEDTEAKDYAKYQAFLVVTVDASGEARIVKFDSATQAKMNANASYRAFAERARDAVLSPTCSKLPVPSNLLGKTSQLRFVFRP